MFFDRLKFLFKYFHKKQSILIDKYCFQSTIYLSLILKGAIYINDFLKIFNLKGGEIIICS